MQTQHRNDQAADKPIEGNQPFKLALPGHYRFYLVVEQRTIYNVAH